MGLISISYPDGHYSKCLSYHFSKEKNMYNVWASEPNLTKNNWGLIATFDTFWEAMEYAESECEVIMYRYKDLEQDDIYIGFAVDQNGQTSEEVWVTKG
jgi:hypothetical protein